MSIDLFLVPQPCLRFLRYAVEILFSIHGETELNMIRPPGIHLDRSSRSVVKSDWPEQLRRRWRMAAITKPTAAVPAMSDH